MNEETVVSVSIGDESLEITGRVVYVDQSMGFAMQFDALTAPQVAALTTLLGDPPDAEAELASAQMKERG